MHDYYFQEEFNTATGGSVRRAPKSRAAVQFMVTSGNSTDTINTRYPLRKVHQQRVITKSIRPDVFLIGKAQDNIQAAKEVLVDETKASYITPYDVFERNNLVAIYPPTKERSVAREVIELSDVTITVFFDPIERTLNNFIAESKYPFSEFLVRRLKELSRAVKSEDNQESASLGSIKFFLKYIQANQKFKLPEIVISYDGYVRAEWDGGEDQHFAILFFPNGKISYVLFAPNPKHPNEVIRQSGKATIDTIESIVKPLKVEQWCINEG